MTDCDVSVALTWPAWSTAARSFFSEKKMEDYIHSPLPALKALKQGK